MPAVHHVYSKLVNNQRYVGYAPGGGDIPVEAMAVLVMGGAGLADENLHTPMGVQTKITEEQAAFLESNSVFKVHKAKGKVTIERRNVDIEKVIANLGDADPSSPITPSSFEGSDLSADTGNAAPSKVRGEFEKHGAQAKPLSTSVSANKKRR